MNIEEINKWLKNEYGCSYTRLEELHDFMCEQDIKHQEEISRLNNIISELYTSIFKYDVFKEFSFPLMDKETENQIICSIDYEWKKFIKDPFLKKINELKNNKKEITEENIKKLEKTDFKALGRTLGTISQALKDGFDEVNTKTLIENKKIPKLNKKHFHKKQRQLANKINEIIDELERIKS